MNGRQAAVWAGSEFGEADLGHRARTTRLVRMAADLIRCPAASLPKAIRRPAQAKAAYRFLSHEKVTPEGILSGHVRTTGQRCVEHEVVLVLQDTTTLTFHSRAALQDLGPVSDIEQTKGFFAHTSLAVARDDHAVLGALHQHVWVRSREKKPAKETARQRKKRARESQHWADNQRHVAERIAEAARDHAGNQPRVIAVFDREGDIFEAMEALDELGHYPDCRIIPRLSASAALLRRRLRYPSLADAG